MIKAITISALTVLLSQTALARTGTKLTCHSPNSHYGFSALLDWEGSAELHDQFLHARMICRRQLLSELTETGTARCVGQWEFGSDDIAIVTFSKNMGTTVIANITTPYRQNAAVECKVEKVELGPL